MHAFGDVPMPIAIGALKDALAPACTPDGAGHLGDKCADHQRPALRAITLSCALFIGFSVLFFAIARCKLPRHIELINTTLDGANLGLDAPLLGQSDTSSADHVDACINRVSDGECAEGAGGGHGRSSRPAT